MKVAMARLLLSLISFLLGYFPDLKLQKLKRRLEISILFRTDIFSWRVERLRDRGAKIGSDCRLFSDEIYSEPILVEIGNHVCIADGTRLITHDGGVWIFWDEHPEIDHYGKIVIGNNVFIGMNVTVLPGTSIGDNCVVGASAVLRGNYPDNSVILGNPAKVKIKTSFYSKMIMCSEKTISTALISLDVEGIKQRNAMIRKVFDAKL